ncbi:MAG: tetratricopeptide repeat protein [Nitrospinota bacterium]|nr:tetratricopeptide repeat protein [Nitrospinota bacterium]
MTMRSILAAFLFLLAFTHGAWADPAEVYNRANALFAREQYPEALKLYESIPIQNPDLEYNIGATYLKMGAIGKATLHFKRAERLRPGDEDTRANLEFIAATKADREAFREQGIAAMLLEWLLGLGSVAHVTQMALGLYLASSCAAMALILARPGAGKNWIAMVMTILMTATAFTSALAAARIISFEDRSQAVVMTAEAPARPDPSAHADPAFTLHEATIVQLGRVEGNYIFVTLASGHSGWMDRGSLERI